jgi:hypothetical protein
MPRQKHPHLKVGLSLRRLPNQEDASQQLRSDTNTRMHTRWMITLAFLLAFSFAFVFAFSFALRFASTAVLLSFVGRTARI